MKTHLLFFIFLMGIVIACKEDTVTDPATSDNDLKLKTGKVYNFENNDFTVKIKQINDSRCPVGVVCVWQGEVAVFFEISNGQTWDLVLKSVHQPVDTLNGYIFKLIDVLPYPVYQVDIPDSDRTVILQIDKQK